MTKLIRSIFACALATCPMVGQAEAPITLSELLKGSKVPPRREFPLSKTVKACDDFHRYVCEPVERSFTLPKDRSSWYFSFSDSAERMLHVRKAYFKRLAAGLKPKLERTKNVQRLYTACMNSAAGAKGELAYVKSTTEMILAAKDPSSLRDLLNSWWMTPQQLFIGLTHVANQDDPDRLDVMLTTDGMTLPERSYYEEKAPPKDLHKMLKAMFDELKLDQSDLRAAAVVAFESGFAKANPLPQELRKRYSENTYQKREAIVASYPHLKIKRFFQDVPDKVMIRNFTPESMAYLNQYFGEAPLLNAQSVILYYALQGFMDDAYPKFYQVLHEFNRKHRGGPPVRPPRDERCTGAAMALGKELDAELLAVLFAEFDDAQVRELAEGVRETILAGLKRNTWLSEPAREEAIRKIKTANLQLVKPESDKDWDFTEIGELSETDAIGNGMALEKAGIANMLKKIREPRNRQEWFTGPLTVNAFYSAENNQFTLPQGILQFPFFDSKQSRIANLAAMGMVVGHELGHAVDDEGSKYDAKGRLRQWMTESDLKAFNARGEKLIQQFEKVGHNGKLTLGENIGDNVGLYFAAETAFPKPVTATAEQLREFYISYGRLWCAKQTKEIEKVRLKTNEHALPRARINQQVVHHELFYTAFGCKAGDKMYLPPADRVQVW